MNTKMRDLSDIELQLVGAGGVGDPIGSYGDPQSTNTGPSSPPSGRTTTFTIGYLGPPATG